MRMMKSFMGLAIILILSSLFTLSVSAGGFFFDREKFIEDTKLRLDDPPENFLPPKISANEDILTSEEESIKRFILKRHKEDQSMAEEKKPKESKIGISISQTSGFFNLRSEPASSTDDRMIAKIVNTLPFLLEKDSRGESLESLGKIIEPRINLYFEF